MGIFLRGDMWWMEYRTRKTRKVVSTGFRKGEKVKAKAAYAALRLGMGSRPKRTAMEAILEAIYGKSSEAENGIALNAMWTIYKDWCDGKGKVVATRTEVNRMGLMDRFVKWSEQRGLTDASDITVAVARDYIVEMRKTGRANKTLRTYAQYLSGIWKAVGQMKGGHVDNPWLAACPDPDHSGEVRLAFSPEQEAAVLAAAKEAGHGWWLASMISRWTGLRYGDVAHLEWGDVDLDKRLISLKPAKTRRHGVSVLLPISDALYAALTSAARNGQEGLLFPEHALAYPAPIAVPFSAVLKAAGVVGAFSFHSWRHTFRTRLAEAGVSDEVARRLGGWTNLAMAAHYDHASHLAEMREAIGKMGNSQGHDA